LGVIGYLLLTGALPFFGATPDQLLRAIIESVPKPIHEREPDLIPELVAVIERCLQKNPAARFDGLRALATALASAIKALRYAPAPEINLAIEGDPDATQAVDASTLHLRMQQADSENTVLFAVPEDLSQLLDEHQPDSVDMADESLDFDGQVELIPEPLTYPGEGEVTEISGAIQASMAQMSPPFPVAPDSGVEDRQQEDRSEVENKEDLTAAMAAAIGVFEDEDPDPASVLRDSTHGASTPITDASGPLSAVSGPHSPGRTTGSLLPEDLLAGLGDEIAEVIGLQPLQPNELSVAPVASLSDFEEIETMSERDKKKRLAEKTSVFPKLGGLNRPWVVAFLLMILLITALTAKIVMSDHETSSELSQKRQSRMRLALRAKRRLTKHRLVRFQTVPVAATVFLKSVAQGVTPYNQIIKGTKIRTFTVVLDGYESAIHTVDPTTLIANGKPSLAAVTLVKAKKISAPSQPATNRGDNGNSSAIPAVVQRLNSAGRPSRDTVNKKVVTPPKRVVTPNKPALGTLQSPKKSKAKPPHPKLPKKKPMRPGKKILKKKKPAKGQMVNPY
jgi:hypothetical protein